jgi:hypothetical protein
MIIVIHWRGNNVLELYDYNNALEREWDDFRAMNWNIMIRYGNKIECCCDWNNALKWWNVKIRYCNV